MGFYERVVFPWLNDVALAGSADVQKLRAEALSPARGRVVEVGFGTGLNLPHYPAAVTSVTAVEPNEGMSRRAKKRVAASRVPVEIVHGAGESLPLEDTSFDTAVLVLTLCSVTSPESVLRELRRVLREDGQLLVLEHGLSPDARIARWQRRLNPLQNIVAAGCNINRPVAELVTRAGFAFETVRNFYAPALPRPYGWMTSGAARLTSPVPR